jgi:alpha-galactosidase
LALYVRSRMSGVLGLCFRSVELSEGDAATIAREIDIYKGFRETLKVASGSLLTAQASPDDGPAWDVLQATAEGSQQALICAYQTNDGVQKITVKPVGLDSAQTYQVWSVDSGALGKATGAELMTGGIEIQQSPNTAAHILIIRMQD